jgi:hypothetical protein
MNKLIKMIAMATIGLASINASASIQIPLAGSDFFVITKVSVYNDFTILYLDKSHGVCNKSPKVIINTPLQGAAYMAFTLKSKIGFGLNDCLATDLPTAYRIDVH